MASTRGEKGVAEEGVVGVENNVLGLVPYKDPSVFYFLGFSFSFCFYEFCRSCDFEFLNYLLIKNLEIHSNFF
jgi:hypothetical protein